MIEPRSDEHAALRAGKITGSRFKVIMNGGPKAWNSLMNELRNPKPFYESSSVESLAHGLATEPRLLAEYEIRNLVEIERPAFIQHPTLDFIGYSPDGIVPPNGGIEGKCPFNPQVHADTLVTGMPPGHMPQVQGGIWVCERDWWDFVSFDPRQEPQYQYFCQRIYRNQDYIDLMHERCLEFWNLYSAGEQAVRKGPTTDMLARLTF